MYAYADRKGMIPGADPKKTAAIGIRAAEGGLIPALVSHGEFRVSPDAVNHYGSGLLSAVNEMSFPKFAEGGLMSLAGGSDALSDKERKDAFDKIIKVVQDKKPDTIMKGNDSTIAGLTSLLRNADRVMLG